MGKGEQHRQGKRGGDDLGAGRQQQQRGGAEAKRAVTPVIGLFRLLAVGRRCGAGDGGANRQRPQDFIDQPCRSERAHVEGAGQRVERDRQCGQQGQSPPMSPCRFHGEQAVGTRRACQLRSRRTTCGLRSRAIEVRCRFAPWSQTRCVPGSRAQRGCPGPFRCKPFELGKAPDGLAEARPPGTHRSGGGVGSASLDATYAGCAIGDA